MKKKNNKCLLLLETICNMMCETTSPNKVDLFDSTPQFV